NRFLSEGRQSGLKEGIAQGLEQGIEKGALAQQRRTVLQAHGMGMKPKDISVLTGLTEAEVEEILAGSE
ncbi:MAG: transposase, partial [Candidatus Electrothrix sp. EH2]|nr:transposase [Candidatus Electrothrix sp. EH2]